MCYATVMACDDLCHHMSHVTCSDALLRVFAYSGFGLCFACDAFSSILYLFRVVTFLASSDGKHVHLWINHYQKWYFFWFCVMVVFHFCSLRAVLPCFAKRHVTPSYMVVWGFGSLGLLGRFARSASTWFRPRNTQPLFIFTCFLDRV